MCSVHHSTLTHMQHDPTWPLCDLDLRSNFQVDLSRSRCICFDLSWCEKHDDGKIICLAVKMQKLYAKNVFAKNDLFLVWWPLEPKILILAQIWGHHVDRKLYSLSNYALAFLSSFYFFRYLDLYADTTKYSEISENLTFGDLWWPQYWSEQKNDE